MVQNRVVTLVNSTNGQPLPQFNSTLTIPIPIVAPTHWSIQYDLLSESVWYQLVFFIEKQGDNLNGLVGASVGGATAVISPITTINVVQPIGGPEEGEGNSTGITSADFMNGKYSIAFNYDGQSVFTLSILDSTGTSVWSVSDSFSVAPSILNIEAVGFNTNEAIAFTSGEIDVAITGALVPITQQGMVQFGTYQGQPLYWANETGESSNFYQYISAYPSSTQLTIADVVVPSGTNPPQDAQIVVQANSITFNTSQITWTQNGAFAGLTVPVTNSWTSPQNLVIYATLKSQTSIYVCEGSVGLDTNQTSNVFCIPIGVSIPSGPYEVTFSAITMDNRPVSAPVTPASIVVT